MAKQQFSADEKKAYFSKLRAEWQKAKETANINAIQAIIQNHGLNISPISFAIVQSQMKSLGLDGIPYLDCKTFEKWLENGFVVIKGQKSQIHGITWLLANGSKINDENETDKNDSFRFPKVYHLFHRSQVQPLEN